MKKFLSVLLLLALAVTMLTSCSSRAAWTAGQRQNMLEILHSYRQMLYTGDLSDSEFTRFAGDVATRLEERYPSYVAMAAMPAAVDSIDRAVMAVITSQLKSDSRNIRHVYPYNYLVAQGALPAGLDSEQQRAFYRCLAGKIRKAYDSEEEFVAALMANLVDPIAMRRMQAECADALFAWMLTEVDIIETTSDPE